ncbi:MAG: ribosome maturation factor RimM [Acidimicrobiales bacterium]
MTARRLLVGRIVRSHGLRGEVVVDLLSSEPERRLAPGCVLELESGAPITVVDARPHQQRWLVTIEGVGDRSSADALRGVELYAEAFDDPDALWVHELVGARVADAAGQSCGTVVAVHANPASDLLELSGGALVPERFVVGWQGEGDARRLVVDPPPGLLDLG